jgi:GNAT superfamily N-acetyltransferase
MSAAGISIRPAVPADASALSRMAREFADELAALPVDADAPDIPEPEDAVLTAEIIARDVFGAQPLAFVLIAERGDDCIGYLMAHFGYWPADAAATLHVVDLFVRPAARRLGTGRALMEEAVRVLRRKGGQRLIWTVWDQNHPAMEFYRRLGARFFAEERLMTWRPQRA